MKKRNVTLSRIGTYVSVVIPAVLSFLNTAVFGIFHPATLAADHANIKMILACVAVLILVPLHEAIHVIGWDIKTGNVKLHFEEMPKRAFVTFEGEMKVSDYAIGTLMPYLVLTVVPSIFSILTGNFYLLVFANIHSFGCCSDLVVFLMSIPYWHKTCRDAERGQTGVVIID